MKILFLLKNSGVEKTTAFIEVIRELAERGAQIDIVIANQSKEYIKEHCYEEELNIRINILNATEDEETTIDGLKQFIRQYKIIEKISWSLINFIAQWMFWIKTKVSKNDDVIFEEFLTPHMWDYKPQKEYDFIWTTDESGLLWAEWINLHTKSDYKIVHHSFELYWEHYSLQSHKQWQYLKLYALFEKARIVLQKADIIIIQDKIRWNVLCQYTGLDKKNEKVLLPVSIKDYRADTSGNIYNKLNIDRKKKIIFYPTSITPSRGCIELVKMTQNLDDEFVTVIHGFEAVKNYLNKIKKKVLFPSKSIISNMTLDYRELVDIHQDVWCVFLYYSEENYNEKYIVNSSNKLVMALQAGKPIITLGNKTLADLCAEYDCGIAINSWSEKEFAAAVNDMKKNYDFYCNNARRCYEERFNIKLYSEELYNKLLSKI